MHKLGYCKRFCSANCDKCQGSYIKKKQEKKNKKPSRWWRVSTGLLLLSVQSLFPIISSKTERLNGAAAPMLHASRNVFSPKIFAFQTTEILPCASGETDAQWSHTVGWFDRTVQNGAALFPLEFIYCTFFSLFFFETKKNVYIGIWRVKKKNWYVSWNRSTWGCWHSRCAQKAYGPTMTVSRSRELER